MNRIKNDFDKIIAEKVVFWIIYMQIKLKEKSRIVSEIKVKKSKEIESNLKLQSVLVIWTGCVID